MDDLIERIYEAAAVPDLWPDVLDRLGHKFHTQGGLLFANSPAGTHWLGGGNVTQIMAEFLAAGWMEHNTRPGILLERRHPGFLTDTQVMTEAEIEQMPMFRDFLIPKGCFATAGTLVPGLNDDMMILSVEGFQSHLAAREAIPQLDDLRPHLARAAQLASQFRLERMKGHVDALEMIGAAAAVLDGRGRVQVANAKFQKELGKVVFDRSSRMHLADKAADALLQNAVKQVQAGRFEGRSVALRDMVFGPRVLHLLPIKREASDLFVSSSALAILTNPYKGVLLGTELLQNLFDLTASEAKLAARLCSGNGAMPEIAQEFGVSVNTVRTQLQSVYEKTGANRQVDLARLLLATNTFGPTSGGRH